MTAHAVLVAPLGAGGRCSGKGMCLPRKTSHAAGDAWRFIRIPLKGSIGFVGFRV